MPETPMWNGHARTAYRFTGSADSRALFEQWQAGEITTVQFQTRTPRGDGTASVELAQSGGTVTLGGDPVTAALFWVSVFVVYKVVTA